MKTKQFSILALMAVFFLVSCSKNDDDGSAVTPEPEPEPTGFIEADPNINDGVLTFEETGPSFSQENRQPDDRTSGNWSNFGSVDGKSISIEYADNPSLDEVNGSAKVIKVTEPAGVESWAGFYFELSENITFPAGSEAISIQFYSPEAGHDVLLKLEDDLANNTSGKKSTGDLFAVTTGTGWETLIFNIPEINGERSGIYNTITMILGYGVSNAAETIYYIDNINISAPVEEVVASAPTTAPSAPTYTAAEVMSIFSDTYTAVPGLNLNPNWGQSTVVSTETIADNTVLKYENLNYQGTEISPAINVSQKGKVHIDYFSGDATILQFFLISPDGDDEGDQNDEIGVFLDVTNPGQWNSVDIDLSSFESGVDLTNVFQLKVTGNGTVYFDNIFFYGGGSQSGQEYTPAYTGTFGGATVADGVYNFPSGAEAWAGFANENTDIVPLSFPYGGTISFTGSAADADVSLNFKFERLAYPDTEPSFFTASATITGAEATEYTINIPAQDEANTYSSALLYLLTRDANVTLTNFVIKAYDSPQTGTNYSPEYSGAFGGSSVVDGVYNFPSGAEAWAGFSNNNATIYPLSFPNGGRITFTGAAAENVELNFKFERAPYPDTEPSFSTANVTVSGAEATEYSIDIPAQNAEYTFSSALMYLVTQDVEVTLSDFVITAFE